MQYFSQRDPAYGMTLLPLSNLHIKEAGCYLCSIANLAQVAPLSLLGAPGGFVQGGLLVSDAIARAADMLFLGMSNVAPKGWCIGRTDAYADKGFPTHFLCVNMDTHEMIDPLHFPAAVQPLTYNINQYRVFSGVKLDPPQTPPPFEAPSVPGIPDWAAPVEERARRAGISTPLTDTVGSLPIYQLLLLVEKYLSVPHS